jgi:hypothetical protein
MGTMAFLLCSVLFGGFGIGYFLYGKKQRAVVPFCAGLGLLIFPYFMSSLFMLLIVGAILIATPYFIKL